MRERFTPWILLAPSFIVLLAVGVYPLLYSLWVSLRSYFPTSPTVANKFIFLANYRAAFEDPVARHALQVTALFTLFTVGISLILGLGLALLLNQRLRGLAVARTMLLIPIMVTPIAVGITWRILYNPELGVFNYLLSLVRLPDQQWLGSTSQALPSIVIMDVWQWTPFMFLILFAGLRSLPQSPFEAASIDGASAWQIFRSVTLPMLRPVILLAILLRSVDAVRMFDQVFIMTRGGPNLATDLASVYLYRVNFKFYNIGYGAALSWGFLLLLLLTVLVFIRYTGFLRKEAEEKAV